MRAFTEDYFHFIITLGIVKSVNKENVHLSLIPEVGNLKYCALRESVHLGRVHLERVDCTKTKSKENRIKYLVTVEL